MSEVKVEVIAQNSCRGTGEGPHWEASSQSLLYVDIQSADVHRWSRDTGTDQKYHVADGYVGFVVPRKSGGYVVGLNKTLATFDPESGRVNTLLEVDHKHDNRFNDGKCDRNGRLWAGTMLIASDPSVANGVGSLYCLTMEGSLSKKLDSLSISNGLAWSADDKTMYFIDSVPRCVYAFDYDADTGEISKQRVAIQYPAGSEASLGWPDGMCIDTDDKLWVACFGAGKVIRWDPVTGEQLQTVELPGAANVTSCCWGGPDLAELYVTCSAHEVSTDAERQQWPNAGSVFRVTGLGVTGTPGHVYQG